MSASKPDAFRRFFHWVSNIRPVIWITVYLLNVPVFAFLYWLLPAGEFRIPDQAATDFGSWLYYSIVTLTTLGFGDYTPCMPAAQAITAVEVLCGLTTIGFFLNAVGSMKSEIMIDAEYERQRRVHEASETARLSRSVPVAIHKLNTFLAYCYAVTTPLAKRGNGNMPEYNPDFTFADMADLYRPSHLPMDHTAHPAVEGFLHSLDSTALFLDHLQQKVDMTLWPELMEECFSFVANSQMFASSTDIAGLDREQDRSEITARIAACPSVPSVRMLEKDRTLSPYADLYHLVKTNASLACKIEATLSSIAGQETSLP